MQLRPAARVSETTFDRTLICDLSLETLASEDLLAKCIRSNRIENPTISEEQTRLLTAIRIGGYTNGTRRCASIVACSDSRDAAAEKNSVRFTCRNAAEAIRRSATA